MANRSGSDVTGMNVSDAFDRFLTAAELLRRKAAPKLVLGGGGNRRIGWSESGTLLTWLGNWGIDTNRVRLLPVLRNTYEEAVAVRAALQPQSAIQPQADGRESTESRGASETNLPADLDPRPSTLDSDSDRPRILLVTSAYHMRRAEAVFRKAGLDVIPVACDFVALSDLESKPLFNPIPKPDGFHKTRLYMHEVIGWWVYKWRGWI